MAYWYHFAIMFESVFILTAVDTGTRVGRFFLQEMIGQYIPKFNEKRWMPGILITSFLFTGAWGYLVCTGDITTIWPLFGMSNQLLASSALIITTTMIIRMKKGKYAAMTAVPGILLAGITMWAGYDNVVYNYLPKGEYLLVALSIMIMVLMVIVFVGTFRKWVDLLHVKRTVVDDFGDQVLVRVPK
jgi:carbon starvation protein